MRKRKLISALFIGLSLFLLMGQNCGFSGQADNGFALFPGMYSFPGMYGMMNAFGFGGYGNPLFY